METALGWGSPREMAHIKARRQVLFPEAGCHASTGSMTLASSHQHRATLRNMAIPGPSRHHCAAGDSGCLHLEGQAAPSTQTPPAPLHLPLSTPSLTTIFKKMSQVCISSKASCHLSTVTFLRGLKLLPSMDLNRSFHFSCSQISIFAIVCFALKWSLSMSPD